jgi:hypothetical protein
MESIFGNSGSIFNLLGSIGILLVGHLANKYVIPFLKIGKRKQYAQYIAAIANEVTDDLQSKYPEKEWLKHLDEAVDSLISICDISPEIARRAINAVVGRK